MIDAGTKRLLMRLLLPKPGGELRKDEKMKKLGLAAALAATVAVSGCATYPNQYGYDPYYGNQGGYYGGSNQRAANAATGAAVGAVGGAIAGKVIPGVSTGEGAIAGAILGGVLGATVNGRQYYRDTRGYCYYVDQYGQPRYSYDIRC
jgi:hypothetical protein